MAYITQRNLAKVVGRMSAKGMPPVSEPIYEWCNICMFSENEEKRLHAFRELLRHPEAFIGKYFCLFEVVDNLTYCIPDSTPAYHTDDTCEWARSEYVNYHLPPVIIQRGTEEIHRFRVWFRENQALMENDRTRDLWLIKMCSTFDLELRTLDRVERVNSGVELVENPSLRDVKAAIEDLLMHADEFYMDSSLHKRVLNQYMRHSSLGFSRKPLYANRTGFAEGQVKDILLEFHRAFKIPLMQLLRTYYQVQCNPDLAFDGTLFEQLGLRECRVCAKCRERSLDGIQDLPVNVLSKVAVA